MGVRAACVFGPVPSRRLGSSLGVNNIEGRQCSYSCVYCQAGRTSRLRDSRRAFADPGDLRAGVEAALDAARAKGVGIDVVSFVPTGEPTLDAGLGRAIGAIKRLGVRVAVITNGSLLWRSDVRDELALADWVSVKVDAVIDVVWRRINRPHRRLDLDEILDGLRTFARRRAGTFVTETMLVGGVNDADDAVDRLSREIADLNPSTAWLAAPVRPPAEPWVSAPQAVRFDRAVQVFRSRIPDVRSLLQPGSGPWRVLGAEGRQLLAMAAVHPLRHSELEDVLGAAGARWSTVDALLTQGLLETVVYDRERFYRTVRPGPGTRDPGMDG